MESSGAEGDGPVDPDVQQARNVASAYNQSIYLMVSMPYLLLGVFGFMIYRGVKRNEAFRKQQGPAPQKPAQT